MLAAVDNASHLQVLADLTSVLQEPDQIDDLIACQHADTIWEKIKQYTTKVNRMKILVVCGSGLGSSFILELNVKKH